MTLKAYEAVAPEPLTFPIGGKLYAVPPVSFQTALRLTEMIDSATASGPDVRFDETPDELWRMILGPAFGQMKADDVPAGALARAGFAALTDFQFGRDAAVAVWENGLSPDILDAARQARIARAISGASDTATEPAAQPAAEPARKPRKTSTTRKPGSVGKAGLE